MLNVPKNVNSPVNFVGGVGGEVASLDGNSPALCIESEVD